MIELDPEQLPDGEEVLGILRQERSQINTWVNVAVSIFIYNIQSVSQAIFSKFTMSIHPTSSQCSVQDVYKLIAKLR